MGSTITVRISFYVNLANNCNYGSKIFGAVLSESSNIFNLPSNSYVINEVITTNFIDTVNWVKFETEYTAKGCEEFLTIGIFNDNFSGNTVQINNISGQNLIYYYIDNVVVESISPPSTDFLQANVITANNDNINDIWYPNVDCIKNWECFILNRWGETVYSFSDSNGWDGKDKNGRILNEGVYFYLLKSSDNQNDISGEIHLVK